MNKSYGNEDHYREFGIFNIINLLNPEAVILDRSIMDAGEQVADDQLKNWVNNRVFHTYSSRCKNNKKSDK